MLRGRPSLFPTLSSLESGNPHAVWSWAKRLTDVLETFKRLHDLATMDLTGKGGYTVKVKTDETGFELVP